MKSNRLAVFLTASIFLASLAALPAANRWWDGGTVDITAAGNGASGGTAGTWDTTILNWDQGNTLAHVAWNNSNNDTAIFAGTAGLVTLGTGGVTANGLTFSTSGYTLESEILTLGGATITTGSGTTTINSEIAGTVGLTKDGAATLSLGHANTYTGNTTVTNGTLTLGADNALNNAGTLVLGATAGANVAVAVNVNGNTTVGGLTAQMSQSTGTASTIGIASGKSLTVNGNFWFGPSYVYQSKLTISGAGTLAVAKTGGEFRVGGTSYYAGAVLDMSGLGTFTANLGNTGTLILGTSTTYQSSSGGQNCTLTLAANSTITAGILELGARHLSAYNPTTHTLNLGTGTNTLNVNNIYLGAYNGSFMSRPITSTVQFYNANGTLKLRDAAGTGRSNLYVGYVNSIYSSSIATVDLNNHSADLLLGTLTIGYNGNGYGYTGTMKFNSGTLDVIGVVIGSGAASGTGTLTLAGGTTAVGGGGIKIGEMAASIGTLNLTGGTLTMNGAITRPVGTATSTLTLDGTVLDMGGYAIGGATTIGTLNLLSGTLKNVSQINNGATGITKTGAGTLTLAGTNTFTGTTTISAGTVRVDGSTATGNPVVVGANTLGGTGTIGGTVTVGVGGTLQPTTTGAAGTLTLAHATAPVFAATSNLKVRVPSSSTADKVVLSDATPGFDCTNLDLAIDPTGLAANATGLTIVQTANATGVTGIFNSVTVTDPNFTALVHYNADSVTIDVFKNISHLDIISVNGGATITSGAAFDVVVRALDATNTPLAVTTDTQIQLSLKTGTGILAGTLNGTITTGNDTITLSGVTYDTAENGVVITATAISGDPLPPGDSAPFLVISTPTTLTLTSGNNQSDHFDAILANPLVVRVTDSSGNPVPNVNVTFAIDTIPLGATGQSLSTTTVASDANGYASSSLTLGNLVGTYTVTATSGSLANSPLTFTAQANTYAGIIYWDGGSSNITANGSSTSDGGNGTWNTNIKNWDIGTNPHVAWNNANLALATANFGGTVGTVTVGSDLTVGAINIDTSNYAIAGGGYNLTLNGLGGIGIAPVSAGKTGMTVSGFNTITLGSNQKWNANNTTHAIDLTVSGGKVETAGYALTLGTAGVAAYTKVTSEITGSGTLTVNARNDIANATAALGSANTHTGVTVVNGYVQVANLQNVDTAWEFGKAPASSANLIFNTGGIQLNGNSSTDHGMTFNGSSGIYAKQRTGTFNGQISGSGTLTIRGDYAAGADGGNGTVVLAAANNYSGTVIASPDCTLRLAHVDALASATLDTTGIRNLIDLTTYNLPCVIGGLKGNRAFNLGSGLGSGGSGAITIGGNHQTNTYSAALSGSAGLIKTGTGTQTFSGNNSYTGVTTINSGIIKLGATGTGANSPLGTVDGGTVVTATGAALDLNGFSLVTAEPLTLNGTGVALGGGVTTGPLMNSSATDVTFGGLITLGSDTYLSTTNSYITLTNTGTITGSGFDLTLDGEYVGTIDSSIATGTGTITKYGTGTWNLNGTNTYTGDTTVYNGTLVLGEFGTLNFAVANSSNTLLSDAGNGTITLNGHFTIDTAVTASTGTWTLVELTNLYTTYADTFPSTFIVDGFTPDGDGVTWNLVDGTKTWTFSETDGTLTLTDSSGGAPEIAVEQPVGTDLPNNHTQAFGNVLIGANSSLSFTIKNTGTAPLTGLVITPSGSSDFSVTASPTAPVAGPSGTTTFTVRFQPTTTGDKTASLSISNNDATESPFVLNLTGTGKDSYTSWMDGFAGYAPGADKSATADADNDGVLNGVEMVLGGNPAAGNDTALLPTIELVNVNVGDGLKAYLLFTYRKTHASVDAGVSSGCYTSATLAAPWTPALGAPNVVIQTDTDFTGFVPSATSPTDRVRVYVPRDTSSELFGRLHVVVP